eukprot:TRINITY_DN5863_c0_g1_i5.p1 TRINITY_DN5863_c0_g1~~TRINITY_DN5863_c0_g1_i5.p1  ORF type:complete len:311 (-),score=49.78 TRINITY_DN5863_c0_g1_i5:518-1450(-)
MATTTNATTSQLYSNMSVTLKPLAGLFNSMKQLAHITFPSTEASYYSSRSSVNIVILGDSNVNKTKLIESYAAEFNNSSDVKLKVGCADRWRYEVQLTAKDYSQTILSEVNDIEHADFTLTGASVCVICFSLTSRVSWKHVINTWLPVCKQYCDGVPVLLLGTNSDERDQLSKRLKQSKPSQAIARTKHSKKEDKPSNDKTELKGGADLHTETEISDAHEMTKATKMKKKTNKQTKDKQNEEPLEQQHNDTATDVPLSHEADISSQSVLPKTERELQYSILNVPSEVILRCFFFILFYFLTPRIYYMRIT